ncbi:putative disease resistance protein RGA4 [Beta vulgaris subsp. vulgaris]|uniref:putative disease resistance protein RGA4 n=1 Tax=Beta vulgaris subsp. vulgaris TaxID=3555 RepID=UPI0020375378|nr:putative disease resistance protein RGA4 [Beta vulgaris subsp. vulgaris]
MRVVTLLMSCKEYLAGKKYLLALGDLSGDQDFSFGKWLEFLEPLLGAFARSIPGSKILVTSRSASVAAVTRHTLVRLQREATPYLLEPLHLNESVAFIQSIAYKGIAEKERNPLLIDIGLEIFNKCANNLHAITIIASILSSEPNNYKKWQHFNDILLARVEDPVICIKSVLDLMQKHDTLQPVLSYSSVPNPLLSYSALFPHDYKFSKRKLQQLWEVQGFLDSVPSIEAFNACFEALLAEEYFLENRKRDKDGEIVYYTTQALMHEVAKHLVRDNCCLLDKPTNQIDAQHVSFIVDSSWKSPKWLKDSKLLKCLLFLPHESCGFVTIDNINDILANLKCLQVLDLAIVNCRNGPDSIGELKQLRYLRLGISFDSLPECITSLQYLSTLDLRHTTIQELPQSFHQLRCLKHLYIGGRLIDLPPRFWELTQLQTLDVFIVGQNNGLNALANLLHLTGKLKLCYKNSNEKHVGPNYNRIIADKDPISLSDLKIDDLSLVWSSLKGAPATDFAKEKNVIEFDILQPPATLKSLAVQGWKGTCFPPSTLSSNLVSLQLQGLEALECIEICQDPRKTHSAATTDFPSLKYLIMVNLPLLARWSKVKDHNPDSQEQKQYVPQKIFNRLSELRISGCPKLMSMPLVPSLEKLEVSDIHEKLLKHLLSTQESQALSSSSESSASPTLKELHINSVHELEFFSITVTSLQVLTITECRKLTNVLVESFNSLKRLKIRACPGLKDISHALHISLSLRN